MTGVDLTGWQLDEVAHDAKSGVDAVAELELLRAHGLDRDATLLLLVCAPR